MKFDGKRLKDMREAKGLSQQHVGDAIGASRASIGQWESGTATPDLKTIGKIGTFFGVMGHFFIVEEEAA